MSELERTKNIGEQISDFIAHRWADAKTELAKLDPDFVAILESEVRLNNIGLDAPWPSRVNKSPKRRLSSAWHRMLENCLELEMQIDCLESAAQLLAPRSNIVQSVEQTGRAAIYQFRNWFIHTRALAEKAIAVIDSAIEIFGSGEPKLRKRFRDEVNEQVTRHVDRQRQTYLHGRRSWSAGITEDQLWEGSVVVGLLPKLFLEKFIYPGEGEKVRDGQRTQFELATQEVLNRLGGILQDLEVELGLTR